MPLAALVEAGSSAGGGEDSCHGFHNRSYRKPGGREGSAGIGDGSPSTDSEGGASGMAAAHVTRRAAPRKQWPRRPSTVKKGGCTAVAERETGSTDAQRTPLPVQSPQANSQTRTVKSTDISGCPCTTCQRGLRRPTWCPSHAPSRRWDRAAGACQTPQWAFMDCLSRCAEPLTRTLRRPALVRHATLWPRETLTLGSPTAVHSTTQPMGPQGG